MASRLDIVRHLLRIWDPIGVFDTDDCDGRADDEYDGYALGVLTMLEGGVDADSIARHLAHVRSEVIGLGDGAPQALETDIANQLVDWRTVDFGAPPPIAFSPDTTKLRCRVRLMFDWDGGCLWSGDARARRRFDAGPIEDRLPLSLATRDRLETLGIWHDTALDRNDPAGGLRWDDAEIRLFEADAQEIRDRLQDELGPEYLVAYESLLSDDRA